ncbi:DUF4328 domain-containing protein [Pseudonocardiaceae bacterium YIM PH 21723]|nr:DUF4328 domain-containing protein [Pseudonocardiaceae bacterium YIM PH 21723]
MSSAALSLIRSPRSQTQNVELMLAVALLLTAVTLVGALAHWPPSLVRAIIPVGCLLVLGGCLFSLLAWVQTAKANAETISPRRHRIGQRMLVVGWFVPLIGPVVPYMALKDIWKAGGPDSRPLRFGPVEVWFLSYLVFEVLILGLNPLLTRYLWRWELSDPVYFGIVQTALVGMLILLVLVLRRITDYQEFHRQRLDRR